MGDLEAFFKTARADVEEKLKQMIEGDEEQEKLKYFLNSGKRLRPLFLLLIFKSCGGTEEGYGDALNLAAAIELQHSASLIHDDIIDGDVERRGKSSYYKTFGVADAILTGHRAIVLGFKSVLGHDQRVLQTLFNVWEESLRGEIKDIEARKNIALIVSGEKLYREVILKKTASLFAGAAKLGTLEACASCDLQSIFCDYGKHIGVAYQLADDSHDIDNDLNALPFSWIFRQLDDVTKGLFIARVENDGLSPSKTLSELGIDYRRMFIEEIARMQNLAVSIAESSIVPDNEFKPLLLDAPKYIVKKCLEN